MQGERSELLARVPKVMGKQGKEGQGASQRQAKSLGQREEAMKRNETVGGGASDLVPGVSPLVSMGLSSHQGLVLKLPFPPFRLWLFLGQGFGLLVLPLPSRKAPRPLHPQDSLASSPRRSGQEHRGWSEPNGVNSAPAGWLT